MGILAWRRKSKKLFLGAVIFGVITIAVLPRPGGEGVKLERQSTIWARINNYKESIQFFWEKPVFGQGFNTLRYVKRDKGLLGEDDWRRTHSGAGVDSSLLFTLATTGVVGLVVYLDLLEKMIKQSLKEKKGILLASGGAILIHSMFNNSLFYSFIMLWWWILLGIEES